MTTTECAKICHEANRAYCESMGDASQLPWEQAPEWQKLSAIKGVQFHLKALIAGDDPKPSQSHESWLKDKLEQGWTWGPEKDSVKKTHPCCVPFDELPATQQAKDHLFVSIVYAMFRAGVMEVPVDLVA